MGNVQEPAKTAQISNKFGPSKPHSESYGILGEFMKSVPIEVKLHSFSYMPLNDLPNLLLISKPIQLSILSFDNLFEIHYPIFRKKALKERISLTSGLVINPKKVKEIPEDIKRVKAKYKRKNISQDYYRLKKVAQEQVEFKKVVSSFPPLLVQCA